MPFLYFETLVLYCLVLPVFLESLEMEAELSERVIRGEVILLKLLNDDKNE